MEWLIAGAVVVIVALAIATVVVSNRMERDALRLMSLAADVRAFRHATRRRAIHRP